MFPTARMRNGIAFVYVYVYVWIVERLVWTFRDQRSMHMYLDIHVYTYTYMYACVHMYSHVDPLLLTGYGYSIRSWMSFAKGIKCLWSPTSRGGGWCTRPSWTELWRGTTGCSKNICEESYPSHSISILKGRCVKRGRSTWCTIDMWFMGCVAVLIFGFSLVKCEVHGENELCFWCWCAETCLAQIASSWKIICPLQQTWRGGC